MKNNFLLQYITHPRTVGAILPSSKRLARKMVESIDFENAKCIVELGPGTGVFTENILKKRNKDTIIILIEYNKEFYEILKEKFAEEKNFYIINDSAENIDYYLDKYFIDNVDYIVSGLPFASLPAEMSNKILEESRKALGEDGRFITFQYTKFKKQLINNYFKEIKINRELVNIPPAYVFLCTNEK